MLMKTPPSRYREISGSVRRRPRRGLFLACLPLSGLLLGLFACALIGAGVALFWLTTPPDSDSIARVRRLQPLPPLTSTPPTAPVAGPETGEGNPAEQNSPPPAATPDPTPPAPVAPAPAPANNPAQSVAAAPEPPPVPASAAPSTPLPALTPSPIVAAGAEEGVAPADTPPAVPIPDSWKDYMKRN